MDKTIIDRLRKLDTTSVSDAMDKLGAECCVYGVKPIQRGLKICGRAFTVHYVPCETAGGTVGDFLDDVAPGQVVVIDNGGRDTCTVWGDIMAKTASLRGIEGTVIDGVCRDVPAVLECGYPIFSKGYYMRTGKDRVRVDGVNVPVRLSDQTVRPGDIILGDDTGIVVIPQELAEQAAEIAETIEKTEAHIVELVSGGMSLKEARRETNYHHLQSKSIETEGK